MNLDNIEIEKNIKELKDNYNNNKKSLSKKNLIKDNRIWTQKTKIYISNIVFDINRDVKFIEKAKLLLNEIEDINISNNNNDIYRKQLERKKKINEEKPIKIYKGITSQKYASILKSIYNKINQMNEESKKCKNLMD
jgi:putative ubiquitin-RnfH superfamily antitoxin RatB of RatAB toxin-antitoxin module